MTVRRIPVAGWVAMMLALWLCSPYAYGGAIVETADVPVEQLRPFGEETGGETPVAQPVPSDATPVVSADIGGGAPEYRIAAGDVLGFQSYDDETISNPRVVVRFDGKVSLPLIEDITVAGLTREQAYTRLQEAYQKVFRTPQFSLTVADAAGQVFYVLGAVNGAREYPLARSLNVLQAINVAGGMRDRNQGSGETYAVAQGALTVAYVIRHQADARQVYVCDLKGLTKSGPHGSDFPVWPNDVVYVPEGVNLVYIMGAVSRPGVISLLEDETLLQVLARSSGLIESTASLRRVVLIRRVSQDKNRVTLVDVKSALRTGEDIVLQGGDIIYAPRKTIVRIREFVDRFTGSIIPWMTLYQEAYDTYYTRDRLEKLLESTDTGTASTLAVLEGLRDFGSLVRDVTSVP